MEPLERFKDIMNQYISLFDALIEVQKNKIDAINKDQITFVEDCMNKEQAAILKMRGLDLHREEIMKKLDCESLTFRQIIDKYGSESTDLLPLYEKLSSKIQLFKSLSENAKDLIEVNLHIINSVLDNNKNTSSPYSQDGIQSGTEKHFTSRFV